MKGGRNRVEEYGTIKTKTILNTIILDIRKYYESK